MSALPRLLSPHFTYRGEDFRLELVRRVPAAVFGITCPVCRRKLHFDLAVHHPIVDLATRELSVRPTISCGHSDCGWGPVKITNGVAVDVDPPPAAEPERSPEPDLPTCPECWRQFNPGAARRARCFDCNPYELHPGARAKRENGVPASEGEEVV